MTNDIDALVRRMSRIAEKLFKEEGGFPPMWLVDLTDGKQELYGTPFNFDGREQKDAMGRELGRIFQSKGVWRYACALECWTSRGPGKPSLDPDRKETVIIYAEDQTTERLGLRDVIRTGDVAYLTKLEMSKSASRSWFTDLVRQPGGLQ